MKYYFISIFVFFQFSLTQEAYNITEEMEFVCNDPIIDCSNRGECNIDQTDCICFEGFITRITNYTDLYGNKPRCNYKAKKQIYALVLSLFLSFGSVHFYLGNTILGYTQLTLFTLIFIYNVLNIINLSLKHIKKTNSNEIKMSISIVITMFCLSFIFFIWYIFDAIMVIFNIYTDKNQVSMEPFI